MNILRRGILVFLLAILVAGLLTSCGGGSGGSSRPAHINYVALGDSLTAGIGASDPSRDFVSLFSAYLQSRADSETLQNLGISGLTTSELLSKLKTDPATRSAVLGADVVTITIGGNDFLPCINPLNGGFTAACANSGVQQFQMDWPAIISTIRTDIGSHAAIYVMNLYDIIPPSVPSFASAEGILQQVNSTLQSSSAGQYRVVDVYSAFKAGDVCGLTHVCGFPPDPHPTDQGYALIASLFKAAYP